MERLERDQSVAVRLVGAEDRPEHADPDLVHNPIGTESARRGYRVLVVVCQGACTSTWVRRIARKCTIFSTMAAIR